jgi:hypothetical protein
MAGAVRSPRLGPWGFALVLLGLLLQLVAAFFWTPGTFVLSAALAVPMVLVGVLLLAGEALGAARAERAAGSEGKGRRDGR